MAKSKISPVPAQNVQLTPLERLRREIQTGLDSGAPKKIADIEKFIDHCANNRSELAFSGRKRIRRAN
jgi:hypothetical protein